MGGGGKGGGCQDVGYAYFADFAYVFALDIDELLEFWTGPDKTWAGSISTSGSHFSAQTGKTAAMYGSNTGPSTVYFYKNQTSPNPYLSSWTGYNIAYKQTAMLVFPQAFIGDNVSSLPVYKIKARKTEYFTQYPNYTYNGDVNPAFIVLDLLLNEAGIPGDAIDFDSFLYAAEILATEDLGLSFKMTRANTITDWLEKIMQHIDGLLFYSPLAGKFKLKLLRGDYDPSSLYVLDDSNVNDVQISQTTWKDIFSTYTLSYVSQEDGEEKSLTFVNNAAYQILGRDKNKSIGFPMFSRETVLRKFAGRLVTKLSTPLKTVKLKVSFLDLPFIEIGDPVLFRLTNAGIDSKVYRIIKMSGDTELDAYIELEMIEDIFYLNKKVDQVTTGSSYYGSALSFELPNPPDKVKIIDAKPEMSKSSAVIILTNKPTEDVLISGTKIEMNSGNTAYSDVYIYCTLAEDVPITEELDRNFSFLVTDTYGQISEIYSSNTNIDNLKKVMMLDEEMIAFQGIEHVTGNTYRILGILRNINNTGNTAHSTGTDCWISFTEARKLKLTYTEANTDTYKVSYVNFKNTSPSTDVTYTYQNDVQTPYAPQLSIPDNHDNSGNILYWRPTVQLSGANYRSPENIVGGEDENKDVGIYEIWNGNTLIDTVASEQTTLYSYDLSSQGGVTTNIKIRKVLNGYYSEFAQVDSNYIAALLQ